MRFVIQHVKAPNDKNGNPRRLYLVTDTNNGAFTTRTQAFDEGYAGPGVIPGHKRNVAHAIELPSVHVTAREYQRLLREHAA